MKYLKLIIIGLLLLFINNGLFAQWQIDKAFGFKINLPSSWNKSSYMDGTDKVYDYYSPDENAAIQLRVFQAGADVTTDLLVQVYEESMLPAGTQKQSMKDHISKNGIPGKQGIYVMDYNGIEVGMAAFYTVQNNKGYVLTAIIPTSMMQQKSDEVRQITQSFIIDGFSPPATSTTTSTATKALIPSSSNQSRSGARPSSNTQSATTHSGNTFTIRSHQAYDFKNKIVESLAASTGGGFAIYSSSATSPEVSGKFIITNYSDFGSAKTWDRNSLSNTGRSDRKNVPLNRVCIYQLRDGSFAKFIFTHLERSINNVVILQCMVEYPASTSPPKTTNTTTSTKAKVGGKYHLISRSDNQSLTNYHFI
ncbi:MAG: hypothetical protein GQ527_13230, partial [Bacteroidales bacterium]|nr:hypothetical protein [Bacteroidales bacterium]